MHGTSSAVICNSKERERPPTPKKLRSAVLPTCAAALCHQPATRGIAPVACIWGAKSPLSSTHVCRTLANAILPRGRTTGVCWGHQPSRDANHPDLLGHASSTHEAGLCCDRGVIAKQVEASKGGEGQARAQAGKPINQSLARADRLSPAERTPFLQFLSQFIFKMHTVQRRRMQMHTHSH